MASSSAGRLQARGGSATSMRPCAGAQPAGPIAPLRTTRRAVPTLQPPRAASRDDDLGGDARAVVAPTSRARGGVPGVSGSGGSDSLSATLGELPVLACDVAAASCETINRTSSAAADPSRSRQVREYVEQLVGNGMSQERAREVILAWSAGGGVEMVDLRKLRWHFVTSTLVPSLAQHMPPALLDVALTSAAFWSLGLLPSAEDAVLHPAIRGALVAVNLLMLVYFASRSLRTTGRMLRIGHAAFAFSDNAELVLLALQALADGHGRLVRAAQGSPHAAELCDVDVGRLLCASAAAITHAKQQQAAAAANAAAAPATSASSGPGGGGALSSLDSFLVLQTAAAPSAGRYGSAAGFDPAAQLGMSAEEAAAVAAAFARYADSTRGRIGEYEFRRLLAAAGYGDLTATERGLALLLVDPDRKGWLSFRDFAVWWATEGGDGGKE